MNKFFNISLYPNPSLHKNLKFKSLPVLSLYIHIPWCVKKCPYCDFNSHNMGNSINQNLYIDALIKDLENSLDLIWGRKIHSIYIGGGTPSLFHPKNIDKILSSIRSRISVIPDAEITMELNPGTSEYYNLLDYFQSGINRISIGIQSFQNKYLQLLGRIHNNKEAIKTVYTACKIFPKVNLDIMYALPNQSIKECILDIKQSLEFDITHLSAYQLTIEKNTYFSKYPPQNLPNDNHIVNIENKIYEVLKKADFKRYEISAFQKNNNHCLHNLNYWKFGDYLGIGAGAHSKITSIDKVVRIKKHKNPKNYLKILEEKINYEKVLIKKNEIIFEFMLNNLRLINGFSKNLFEERTSIPIYYINKNLQLAQSKKLLEIQDDIIKPTELGVRYLNNLLEIFL